MRIKQATFIETSKHIYIEADYDKFVFDELRIRVPPYARKWISREKCWVVNIEYWPEVSPLFTYAGYVTNHTHRIESETKRPLKGDTIKIMYIATTKDPGNGTLVASATTGVMRRRRLIWDICITHAALEGFFQPKRNDAYGALDIKSDATDEEIKKQFRRLSLKFHPDYNKGENADTDFDRIAQAYALIKTPQLRRQYDKRLAMAQKLAAADAWNGWSAGYRSPKTCGILTFDGYSEFDVIYIEKILAWDDIEENGKILNVTYDVTNQTLKESYV